MRGVIADKSTDINRRGEHAEVSLFECADVVGADFGGLGNLGDRELFGLARDAELFGNRWHSPYLAGLTRNWQSWKLLKSIEPFLAPRIPLDENAGSG